MICTELVAIPFMQWHHVDQIKLCFFFLFFLRVRTELKTERKIIINLLSKCPAKSSLVTEHWNIKLFNLRLQAELIKVGFLIKNLA